MSESKCSLIPWLIKSADSSPLQIGLTYDNRFSFQSLQGGIASIIFTYGLILVMFSYKVYNIYNFDPQLSNSMLKRDLFFEPQPIHFTASDFDLMLAVNYLGSDPAVIEHLFSHFHIELAFSESNWDNGEYKFNATNLTIALCDNEAFGGVINYTALKGDKGIQFCPIDLNFTLKGSTASGEFSFIALNVNECSQKWLDENFPGEQCASLEEQKKHIGDISFFITFKTKYFDGYSKTEPIKDHYQTKTFYSQGDQHYNFLHVGLNEAILEDSWFLPIFQTEKRNYTTIRIDNQGSKNYEPYTLKSNFLGVLIFLDDNIEVNKRTAYNLLQAFQELGGLLSFFKAFVSLLFFPRQKFLFLDRLFKSLYYYEKEEGISQTTSETLLTVDTCNNILSPKVRDNSNQEQQSPRVEGKQYNIDREMTSLQRKPKLKTSFFTCLTSCLCKEKKSKDRFNSALFMLLEELNIVQVLQKLRKLDLLIEGFDLKSQQFLEVKSKRRRIQHTVEKMTKGYEIEQNTMQSPDFKRRSYWQLYSYFGFSLPHQDQEQHTNNDTERNNSKTLTQNKNSIQPERIQKQEGESDRNKAS